MTRAAGSSSSNDNSMKRARVSPWGHCQYAERPSSNGVVVLAAWLPDQPIIRSKRFVAI